MQNADGQTMARSTRLVMLKRLYGLTERRTNSYGRTDRRTYEFKRTDGQTNINRSTRLVILIKLDSASDPVQEYL